jgi:hypothetical protein
MIHCHGPAVTLRKEDAENTEVLMKRFGMASALDSRSDEGKPLVWWLFVNAGILWCIAFLF